MRRVGGLLLFFFFFVSFFLSLLSVLDIVSVYRLIYELDEYKTNASNIIQYSVRRKNNQLAAVFEKKQIFK